MKIRNFFRATLLTVATGVGTLAICTSANAASLTSSSTPVDIELSLLVDVSGSIDEGEFNLQKQGYVDVFSDGSLFNNFISKGKEGKIAVNYIYWSSSTRQQEAVGWTLIDSVEASENFANAIDAANRPPIGGTAPGSAINFAVPLFSHNGFNGERQVIDISGDGRGISSNSSTARNNALSSGIDAINGIVIGGSSSVKAFYENNLIGGVNADGTPGFVLEANSFEDFGSAIDKKIKAEITINPPTTSIPEPGSIFGLIAVAGFGVNSVVKRKYKTILCLDKNS